MTLGDSNRHNGRHERSLAASRFFSSLRRLKNSLASFWWLLLLLAGSAAGFEYWQIQHRPPEYISLSRMVLNSRMALPTGNLFSEEWNNFIGTQIALIQSDTVLERARVQLEMTHPAWHSSPVMLEASVSPKTTVFNLRAQGQDPEYTRAFLNACMKEYMDLKSDMRKSAMDSAMSGFNDTLSALENEIKRDKQAALDYAASNSVVLLPDNSAAAYMDGLTKHLADLQTEEELLRRLTVEEKSHLDQDQGQVIASNSKPNQSPAGTNAPVGQTQQQADDHPSLTPPEAQYLQAEREIQLLEAQAQDLGAVLKPKHPKMIALRDKIESQKRLLAIFKTDSKDEMQNRLKAVELQIQNQEAQLNEWRSKTVAQSKVIATYHDMQENIHEGENLYNSLRNSSLAIGVDKEVNPDSLVVLRPASPAVLADPHLLRGLIEWAFGGLVLAIAFLMMRNTIDDRLVSLTEFQDYFDETILGQIPYDRQKGKKDSPLLQVEDDRHCLLEAYRNLRSGLLYLEAEKRPKKILVTSAIPQDGKSSIASNLAVTLAESGWSILLVDGDLRCGALHQKFGLSGKVGLGEVLTGRKKLSEAVAKTQVPNLSLLACGSVSENPGRLFTRPQLNVLLEEISLGYDFAIFDSSPIGAADDAATLAPKMDGVIMVVRACHTPARVARAALDVLYMRQTTILGLIFNAVEMIGHDYYYYRYADYYYGRSSRNGHKQPDRSHNPDTDTTGRTRSPDEVKE